MKQTPLQRARVRIRRRIRRDEYSRARNIYRAENFKVNFCKIRTPEHIKLSMSPVWASPVCKAPRSWMPTDTPITRRQGKTVMMLQMEMKAEAGRS